MRCILKSCTAGLSHDAHPLRIYIKCAFFIFMLCRCFFRELSSAGSCGAFANVRIRSVHKESKHIMICYSLMTEAHFATNCSLKASRVQMAKTGTESVCENCVGDEEMKLLICVRDIDTCNRAFHFAFTFSFHLHNWWRSPQLCRFLFRCAIHHYDWCTARWITPRCL